MGPLQQAQIMALTQLLARRREQGHRIGPGVRNWQRGRSKWTGAELRAIRAAKGVGRPSDGSLGYSIIGKLRNVLRVRR